MEAKRISEILPQVVQNSVQVTQELMPQVNSKTNRLALAIQSKLIKDCLLEEVKEVLRKVMIKIGLRAQNWPNDLEKLVLFEHIVSNFGGNRLGEILLAFDFAINGELADADGVAIDANCYENFSCLYFSKIMNAYRFWSRQEVKYISTTTKEKQKIFSQEELDDYAREDAEWQYQMYRRNLDITYPESLKQILTKDNLLKKDESVIDFFKRKAESLSEHIYTRMNNNY